MDYNSGDYNSGNNNSGYNNSGDRNSGGYNSGYYNSGNYNSGDYNSGGYNSGNRNSGYYNSGYNNSGDYNSGNYSSGYCNSITPEDCLIFNKPAKRSDWKNADKPNWIYVNLTEWVLGGAMTDKEKEAYPSYVTTGGYLKCYSSLKEAYIESWEQASTEDREKTFKLPNFDIGVFEEVFGFIPKIETHTIEIDGKKIQLSEDSFKALKEQLI